MGDNHTVFDLIAAGELEPVCEADRTYALKLVKMRTLMSQPGDSAEDVKLCERILVSLWAERVKLPCLT